MLSDKRLLRRAKQGCRESVRQIYELYSDQMLTLANALLNDIAAAEDVVHDVFVKFAQSLGEFELKKSLRGYFATSTRNRALDMLRARKRQAEKLPQLARRDADHITPEIKAEQVETDKLLRGALQHLPIEQREAVVLRVHTGLSFKQIAEMQAVSANTAQGRYRYGLDKLRSLLNDEDVK
jgi:RNA polymerase sigma-70 factor (ECF subfamily)